MSKKISLLFVLIFSCVNLYAQTEKYTAPVKWERYKVSKREVSIDLPKMPILINSYDFCNEVETATYVAYAEETVYQFKISSKSNEKIPDFCAEKVRFGQKSLENSVSRLKQKEKSEIESKLTIKDREVIKISGEYATYWIFNDLKNNKWIELSVSHRQDISPKSDRFINSLEFVKNSNGIEIRDGVMRTLGDEAKIKNDGDTEASAEAAKVYPIIIVAKPPANYTDAARQAQIQGTVTLRVNFLASGGIGDITILSGLPYGLTEQAILAVGKMVFLPQKIEGKTLTVSKQVQYSFTIY